MHKKLLLFSMLSTYRSTLAANHQKTGRKLLVWVREAGLVRLNAAPWQKSNSLINQGLEMSQNNIQHAQSMHKSHVRTPLTLFTKQPLWALSLGNFLEEQVSTVLLRGKIHIK